MCVRAKGRNQVIERNKESLLRKHAKGSTEEPHWHEELASDAEAFVSTYRPNLELVERRRRSAVPAGNNSLQPAAAASIKHLPNRVRVTLTVRHS